MSSGWAGATRGRCVAPQRGTFMLSSANKGCRGEPLSGGSIASVSKQTESAMVRPANGTGLPKAATETDTVREREVAVFEPAAVDSALFPPVTPKAATRDQVAVCDRLEVDPWSHP